MTRREMLENLEEIKEAVALDSNDELTNYARERAYMSVAGAINYLRENYDPENDD